MRGPQADGPAGPSPPARLGAKRRAGGELRRGAHCAPRAEGRAWPRPVTGPRPPRAPTPRPDGQRAGGQGWPHGGHRRRRREAPLMAREWPLRQARAQQGPRCARRATGGRSLDRGRARRPGPRATDAEGTDRRNGAARPRSRRGAQPRRVGRGRARRPGGWGPWPALTGHGWDPPPKGHAWPPTSRADAQRAEARRAAALGAGATASGVPERAICRPQAPNRAGAGPAPGWGPRTPRAKRWAAWWPSADQKKLRPRPHRGRNYPISGPNSSEPGVRPPTIGSWQAQRLVAPVL